MPQKKLSKKSISIALGTAPKFIVLTTRSALEEQIILKLQPDTDAVLIQDIDLYGLTLMKTPIGFEFGYEASGFISSTALHRKMRALRWLERKFDILCDRMGDPVSFGSSIAYCAAALGVEQIVISGATYPIREAVRYFVEGDINAESVTGGGEIPSEDIERKEVRVLDLDGFKEVVGEEIWAIGTDVQSVSSEVGGCSPDILEVISESEGD